MAYDSNKLVKLGHLKELATKIKTEYATKAELQAIQIPEYSIVKQGTAESGYLSTYYLTKGGEQVGEKINIPRTSWSTPPTSWRLKRRTSLMTAPRSATCILTSSSTARAPTILPPTSTCP